jgi:release factor glutamine methyltransferase
MGLKIQTIKDIRIFLSGELESIYPADELRAIANIVISSVLGIVKMNQLYLSDSQVNDEQASRIIAISDQLKTGKPVQYVLGETIFYNCPIKLNSSTLIPRQETEELVDLIVRENQGYQGNIIDFGTGSGCISIALAMNLPDASVTGTDISSEALEMAKVNAEINNAPVSFAVDDMLNPSQGFLERVAIIVSNPPYVRRSEKSLMNRNVTEFEPHEALFVDDEDPLLFYRAIMIKAERLLLPHGKIYFEINEALGKEMAGLMESFGCTGTQVVKDLNGKDRIIKSIYHG